MVFENYINDTFEAHFLAGVIYRNFVEVKDYVDIKVLQISGFGDFLLP